MHALSRGVVLAAALLALAASSWAEIRGFAVVSDGIYRGSEPVGPEDFARLRGAGVRTILNLRTSRSGTAYASRAARAYGMMVVNVPLAAAGMPSDAEVDRALAVLADPEARPVFVHCKLGQDRTGLVVGLHRVLHEGWPPERAYAEMQQRGFNEYLLGLEWYFWRRTRPPSAVPAAAG